LRVRLREELYAIQRRVKITAIFVTHDQEEALSLADRIAVMNAGRLEQLDKPSAIYAYPRTLFVADFIGVMNIFPVQRQGDSLRIGQYTLKAPEGLAAQSGVSIAIRPEDFVIGEGSAGVPTGWQGTIDQSIDLGHYRKVLVVVPGLFNDETTAVAHRIKVYMPKSVQARAGDRIALTPARYLVYSDTAATPNAQPIEVRNQALRTMDDNWRDDQPRTAIPSG